MTKERRKITDKIALNTFPITSIIFGVDKSINSLTYLDFYSTYLQSKTGTNMFHC